MSKVGDEIRKPAGVPIDSVNGQMRSASVDVNNVAVPLDFYQSVASLVYRSHQFRPPRMRLDNSLNGILGSTGVAQLELSAIMSRETSEVAFQISSLLIRRKENVEEHGDLGALRGLARLDRISRMFEHIYQARINPADGGGEV